MIIINKIVPTPITPRRPAKSLSEGSDLRSGVRCFARSLAHRGGVGVYGFRELGLGVEGFGV